MATLNIDLSEYDMMRESKKNLENQVEDLKKIIEGLKDKSRLVVRDRTMYRTIDAEALRTRLVAEWQHSSYSRAYIVGFAQQFVDLISHLDYSLYLKGDPKEESRPEEYTGHIAMLVYSGMTDILYYNFTLGLRLDAVRDSAHATMLVTEYTGSITIKNE